MLAAHRVPPQLLGIVPANADGFGDPAKALHAFFELQVESLQAVFFELNEQLGMKAVRFWRRTIVPSRKRSINRPHEIVFNAEELFGGMCFSLSLAYGIFVNTHQKARRAFAQLAGPFDPEDGTGLSLKL